MTEKIYFIAAAGDETFDIAPLASRDNNIQNTHIVLCTKNDAIFLECAWAAGFLPENLHIPTNRPAPGALSESTALNMVSYFANMHPDATLLLAEVVVPEAAAAEVSETVAADALGSRECDGGSERACNGGREHDAVALNQACKKFAEINVHRKVEFYKPNSYARKKYIDSALEPIVQEYEQKLTKANTALQEAQVALSAATQQTETIRQEFEASKSFRIGRAITKLPRVVLKRK